MTIEIPSLKGKARITVDKHNNFVAEFATAIEPGRFTKEENIGKLKWNVLGYFSSAHGAVRRIIREVVLTETETTTLKDFLSRQQELWDDIKENLDA